MLKNNLVIFRFSDRNLFDNYEIKNRKIRLFIL